MNRRFSRFLAGLLAAVMMCTVPGIPAAAAQREDTEAAQQQDSAAVESQIQPQETAAAANGKVEVLVTAGLPMNKDQQFQLSLEGPVKQSQTVTLAAQAEGAAKPSRVTADFTDLKSGDYTLKVTADGYVTYTQTVDVKGLGYRLQLYTGKAAGFTAQAHPGLLTPGDVTGDGKLDDADTAAIVDAIENGSADTAFDVNGDGSVDLLDLNYLTELLEGYQKQESTVESYILPETIQANVGEAVLKAGSVEDLLKDEGEVKLAPAGGNTISEENPVEIGFDLTASGQESVPLEEIIIESPKDSDNAITGATVTITYKEKNEEKTGEVKVGKASGMMTVSAPSGLDRFTASLNENGELCVDLGGQIAVKKVTLKVTQTAKGTSLAEISKVEFVNDMEKRIPDPVLNVPTNFTAIPGNKMIKLSWTKQQNVTGYEVMVKGPDKTGKERTDYRRTTANSLELMQIGGEKLVNNKEYTVSVQSVNGEWKSGFCEELKATPKPNGVPDAPDQVSVTGGYRYIEVRWKALEDADSYNLFYREYQTGDFTKVSGITGVYYKVDGLKTDTRYEVYLTATNDVGEGADSQKASGRTLGSLTPAKLPEYKLINTSNGEGDLSAHIKDAYVGGGGFMVDSPLDSKSSAFGLYDNVYTSYMQRDDWDYGGAYSSDNKGIFTEFDDTYEIGMITLAEPVDVGSYTYVSVFYWDENGQRQKAENVSILQKTSGTRKYYLIKFGGPLKTSKIQFGIGRYGSTPWQVTVSEVRFYEYDSIEQDIDDLYEDDLHITLKADVNEKTIETLENRLNTKDTKSGEYHPEREALLKELQEAKELLATSGLSGVLAVNPRINASADSQIAVGGLNSWQPLGVAAAAGEQIVVYVGNPSLKNGARTNLQLVFTQQHAESGKFFDTRELKVGRNEITVPAISTTDKEKGGALYIQYNGNNMKDKYSVRVSGGTRFPVLNVYQVSGEERQNRIRAYVGQLKDYAASIENEHNKVHAGSGNENVEYDYDQKNCIANTTDIVMDQMMLSIPASQALAGLGSASLESRLSDTIQAIEEMMVLFYQHKGLTDSFAEGTDEAVIAKNHLPYRYLNIRYMKMFAGAFMYASGNHIGIEWTETPGMMGGVPVTSTETGKYLSGKYFGWGIAHEVGHEINQSAYVMAEVTNNYFSVLAQAKDANDSVRFEYPEVFKKVTSGAKGYADNVFTQLGLYWQLHLAYDRDYNYKTYETYQEIKDHLFFARVDSYARDPQSAPAPQGIALTLDSSRDQNLMRLASAAAQKNLLDFFERWGMTPDAATVSYAGQFPEEERAICYVDDTARVYEIENGVHDSVSGRSVVTAGVKAKDADVTISIQPSVSASLIQGYEITRVFTEQGKERREVAGFTQESSFTDHAAFASNRVITYEVTAIDKYMNRSAVCTAGTVKIGGDGIQDKSDWTVSTNMASAADTTENADEEKPCEPQKVSAAMKTIDNDAETTFVGRSSGKDPYILLELKKSTEVSALRYQWSETGIAIGAYKIEVSADGETFREVKSGLFAPTDGSETVYFENGEDKWVSTYDAAYVKLTAVGQADQDLSVTEIDLFGPSGDNVEFASASGGETGIGKLSADYVYDKSSGDKIPKDSVVFTGTYKGNPAYNVVVLYDENGQIVGGTDEEGAIVAHQIILAPDPKDALLGETSEGRWIYWIEPKDQSKLPSKVRAELYRVDNALTNEGQRLVSDTEPVAVPQTLPALTLK